MGWMPRAASMSKLRHRPSNAVRFEPKFHTILSFLVVHAQPLQSTCTTELLQCHRAIDSLSDFSQILLC